MPSFKTLPPPPLPIPAGVYIAKIINAQERTSSAGNDMIAMKLTIPDGRTINSILTFVPAAEPVINAFCDSADLHKPAEANVAVDLTASDVLDRYLYIVITTESDNQTGAVSKVTRFLRRKE